ncbi:MAG: hypothetical protein MJY93_01150 [Fibrobacter sp.]|nr:hypothetical protein [Fibrobacter sp.]
MNIQIGKTPLLHYTLPKELVAGSSVNYYIQCGFKSIKWTGIISSVNENKITVRLGNGPFRGFTASHQFVSEDSMTACYDEFSFQGFTTIPEETFAAIISKTSVIYAMNARKDARNIIMALESQKKTQAFEALDQSATAG